MTKEQLEAELKHLETQFQQANMQAATVNGAIMFCKHLMSQLEKKDAPETQQDQGSV
jgi:hypothetical protein